MDDNTSEVTYRRLARAVFEHQMTLYRRYWFNTLVMIVGVYIMFAVVFFGGRTVAGAGINDTLNIIVVGFFLFLATSSAYFDIAGNIMREAQWGTLEQLYMSPFGIGRVMFVKTVYNILFSSSVSLILLTMMLLTTDRTLSIDVTTIVPLLLLTILPAIGIGYVTAGLSLLYKRLESVQQLLQFGLIGLIAAPSVVQRPLLFLLPISPGSDLLTQAMVNNIELWEIPPVILLLLFLNGFIYLCIGYVAFRFFVKKTREYGAMGHY